MWPINQDFRREEMFITNMYEGNDYHSDIEIPPYKELRDRPPEFNGRLPRLSEILRFKSNNRIQLKRRRQNSICFICGLEVQNSTNLRRHLLSVHNNDRAKKHLIKEQLKEAYHGKLPEDIDIDQHIKYTNWIMKVDTRMAEHQFRNPIMNLKRQPFHLESQAIPNLKIFEVNQINPCQKQ